MITQVTGDNFPSYYKATQGQIVNICARFKSDQDLRGYQVNLNPGFFISTNNDAQTMSPGFSVYYPVDTANDYEMTFQGLDSRFKNYKAVLRAISSTEFVIKFTFIQTQDLFLLTGGYLGEYDYDSINEIENSTGQVFINSRFLDLKITVDFLSRVDVCHGRIEWAVKPFRNDGIIRYVSNGIGVNGWVTGEDLEININLPETFAANEFNAAIYKVTGADNDERFIEDLRLNIAYCTGGGSFQALNGVPFSGILSSEGWGQYSSGFECKVTIDKNYFLPGESYRVYLTYLSNFENESLITDIIPQYIDYDIPLISSGNCCHFNETTLENPGETFTETCFQNVNPCQVVEIKAGIDIISFDASLVSKGFTGITFAQIFRNSVWTFTDILAADAPVETIPIISITSNFLGIQYYTVIKFLVPESWAGKTKYVNCRYNYLWPNGQTSVEIAPFLFKFNELSNDITPLITYPNYMCDDAEVENFQFEGPNVASKFLVKKDDCTNLGDYGTHDPDFTGGVGNLDLKYKKLNYGVTCFKLLASRSLPDPGLCEIICDWVTLRIEPASRPEGTLQLSWDFSQVMAPECIDSLEFTNVKDGYLIQLYNFSGIGTNTGTILVPEYKITGNIKVVMTTVYAEVYVFLFIGRRDWGLGKTYYFWPCEAPPPGGSAGLPCEKRPFLTPQCTLTDWDAILFDDGYTVDSFDYSLDQGGTWTNYTVAVPFGSNTNILWRAVLSSLLPCQNVTLWAFGNLCHDCFGILPVNPCDDLLSITDSWSEVSEELTLTETLDPGCVIDNEVVLQYSYDGITFYNYVGPIDTSTTDTVYWKRYIKCVSGCVVTANGTWKRKCPKFNCQTGGGGGETPASYADFQSIEDIITGAMITTFVAGAYFVMIRNTGVVNVSILRNTETINILPGQVYSFTTFKDHVTNQQIVDSEIELTVPANGKVQYLLHYPNSIIL